jgi:uncharacterized membrane protein YgdD (TMEM256/DUF423 family)
MRMMKATTGVLGLVGVGLGAFGAHALKSRLAAAAMSEVWATAVLYHLVHAAALLGVLAFAAKEERAATGDTQARWWQRAGACWIIGVVLFSGSLYWLALGGPRGLGPITPLGGLFLLAGWMCVVCAAFCETKNPPLA